MFSLKKIIFLAPILFFISLFLDSTAQADINAYVFEGRPESGNAVYVNNGKIFVENLTNPANKTIMDITPGPITIPGDFSSGNWKLTATTEYNYAATLEPVSDGTYALILSQMNDLNIEDAKTGKWGPYVPNGKVWQDGNFPINIYLEGTSWDNSYAGSTARQIFTEWLQDMNDLAQSVSPNTITMYQIVQNPDNARTWTYNPNGGTQTSLDGKDYTDPENAKITASTTNIDSPTDYNGNAGELWQKGNGFGPASYSPTCMSTPAGTPSEYDAYTTLLVYWFRQTRNDIKGQEGTTLPNFDDINTMEEMTDPHWEVDAQETSWGAVKTIFHH